jgi:diguanylate cyclase (GGDEF)-like protein/PAS domain S-box-containing protein
MRAVSEKERASSSRPWRALLTTSSLAMASSGLGVVDVLRGVAVGAEAALVISGLLVSAAMFFGLFAFRDRGLQTVATASTIYFEIYLCAGAIIAVLGPGQHLHIFVYLLWFFPLLVFNKLVNAPAVGRLLAKSLLVAPPVVLVSLWPWSTVVFKPDVLLLLVTFCLSYLCYGLTLNVVTNYREDFIVERERAESLKVESELLESISDCFISLDYEFRLVYLNDAACKEFHVERSSALGGIIPDAVPGFFSASILAGLQAASCKPSASMFEAQNAGQEQWYEMRCFPRPGGMSIYFRNTTEAVSSRRKLNEAHSSLREQAELLDKAQDAILVLDMENRIAYWNKGAERLYGWTAAEVGGRLVTDIFPESFEELSNGAAVILEFGEWNGELSLLRRDGSLLIVESRSTLVRGEDGRPRSILAIATDITNRKAAEARIEHLAFYDALTELPNRSLLRERLERALANAGRDGSMGALLFIDLDDFKTLNDTLGHDTGDELLQQVARRLTASVRKGDTVARLGGDEFVVMLEGLHHDAEAPGVEAKSVGDKIRASFRQAYHLGGSEYNSTVSVGVALFSGHGDTVDDLLKRADLAMYQAKAQGRNAMCFFDVSMQTTVATRAALQADLRRALTNREFELYYQPQVDSSGHVSGAEALLRWQHPGRGMVPPMEFIPLAEEAGLIVELGRWVLETACAQLSLWADRPELKDLSLAVNVSVRQFLDSNFVTLVLDVLRETGANPERLKLEITESLIMGNADDTIAKITALKSHRVGFSLDDFGTGYSSLLRLKRLPLDQLKIDRGFVNDVLTDQKDESIVRTIITLGRNLNLNVISEGVETEAQRAFLENEGCHYHQGFLFSPAVTAAKFEAFVAAAPARRATTNAA